MASSPTGRRLYQNRPASESKNRDSKNRTASQNGRCRAGRNAVACFWDPTLHSPRPCQRTVWRGSFAPPCGHFASLVRSFATLIARVPSETLRVSAAHLASLKTGKPPPLPAPLIPPKTETDYESTGKERMRRRRENAWAKEGCADGGMHLRAEGGMRFRGTPGKAAWHSVRMSRHGRGTSRVEGWAPRKRILPKHRKERNHSSYQKAPFCDAVELFHGQGRPTGTQQRTEHGLFRHRRNLWTIAVISDYAMERRCETICGVFKERKEQST